MAILQTLCKRCENTWKKCWLGHSSMQHNWSGTLNTSGLKKVYPSTCCAPPPAARSPAVSSLGLCCSTTSAETDIHPNTGLSVQHMLAYNTAWWTPISLKKNTSAPTRARPKDFLHLSSNASTSFDFRRAAKNDRSAFQVIIETCATKRRFQTSQKQNGARSFKKLFDLRINDVFG